MNECVKGGIEKTLTHRLVDRLEDFAYSSLSTSLYCSYTVGVTPILEDMADFFVNHIRSGGLWPPQQTANIILPHTWCCGGRRPPLPYFCLYMVNSQ